MKVDSFDAFEAHHFILEAQEFHHFIFGSHLVAFRIFSSEAEVRILRLARLARAVRLKLGV